jgi:hypothetical protein
MGISAVGRTTELRQEIKKRFAPYMSAKGFTSDMRRAQRYTFRNITSSEIFVCDVDWHKYFRPRFIVRFGRCSVDGATPFGRYDPHEIFPETCSSCGDLTPGASRTSRGWFRQDRPLLERLLTFSSFRDPSDVVSDLLRLFPEIEDYWTDGLVGPHIRLRSPQELRLAIALHSAVTASNQAQPARSE